jgi:hypothetical protein
MPEDAQARFAMAGAASDSPHRMVGLTGWRASPDGGWCKAPRTITMPAEPCPAAGQRYSRPTSDDKAKMSPRKTVFLTKNPAIACLSGRQVTP